MTHDKIFKSGAGTAYQCCTGIDQGIQGSCKDCKGTGIPIRYLQASSLSVCARGRGEWERGSDSGSKDRLYSQIIPEPDSSASSICKGHWGNFKRDCYTGPRSFSPQGSGAWIKRENPSERFTWNIALTDCQRKRLSKLISFWSLIGSG